MRYSPFLLLVVSSFFSACSDDVRKTDITAAPKHNGANIIVYNVYLKPEDPRDTDAWELYADFDREAFVDSIFASVFYHQAIVTDINGDTLTIEQLKTREIDEPEKYSRDKVAGIQFTEEWSFDPASCSMKKEVRKMLIGYEVIVDSVLFALRPGLIITF